MTDVYSDAPSWWPDLASLTPDVRAELEHKLIDALGPVRVRYTPFEPLVKQETFLRLDQIEAFYGGAAGPGKSTALLMAALQYCDVPGYAALIIRRTYQDLAMPGALMDVSKEWLTGTAHWNGTTKTWTFPSGATLTFGYLKHVAHQYRYRSTEFQFIGFDELTEFEVDQYLYLFSRLRASRQADRYPASDDGVRLVDVPLRMRGASNPGGPGHDWCNERFVDPDTREPGAIYVQANYLDNLFIDHAAYRRNLMKLPLVEQKQLLEGDWNILPEGGMFKPALVSVVDMEKLPRPAARVRWWDMASTEESDSNRDPDYTVGMLLAMVRDPMTVMGYRVVVEDVVRGRWSPGRVDEMFTETAVHDVATYGSGAVEWYIGQEPGSSGKSIIPHYRRRAPGIVVRGRRETGTKEVRAKPAAAASERGELSTIAAPWRRAFQRELAPFPDPAVHDDQVDCLAGGFNVLERRMLARLRGTTRARPRSQRR